jgi:hypothetical protein
VSDLSVGKNGMPVTVSPVRILRPGDPGFPKQDDQEQPDMAENVPKPCGVAGCGKPKAPGMGRRYCAEHSNPESRQKAEHRPAGKKASAAAAKAIAKLRGKAVPPPGGCGSGAEIQYRPAGPRGGLPAGR